MRFLFSCSEKQRLKLLVGGLVWFVPTEDELFLHRDGGVAIIDQWIASHGKYFIGIYWNDPFVHFISVTVAYIIYHLM